SADVSVHSEVDSMSTAQLPQVQAHDYSELGPIAQLVTNPQVTEIMVMGARDIYVEIGGKILLTPLSFASDEELMVVIRRIVESVGRRIDAENPLCDARLVDGSRVHVAIPPVAVDGPLLNIRKFVLGPLTMADLIRLGSCSESAFGFLKACVSARANIIVSGGTGSGKTTLLNVLWGYIPADERIVDNEEGAERPTRQRRAVKAETRSAGDGGIGLRMTQLGHVRR